MNNSKNKNKNKNLLAVAALTAIGLQGFVADSAKAAPPTCVSNLLSGLGTFNNRGVNYSGRNLKIVFQTKDANFVCYAATGNQGFSNDPNGTTASALFTMTCSDRFNPSSPQQNFYIGASESGTITVNRSTGQITMFTFGHSYGPRTASCNGNLMTFSTGNNLVEAWSIAFSPLATFNVI